jgi:hypothetical protein
MRPVSRIPTIQSKSEKDVESIIYPVFGLSTFMKIPFTFSLCFIAVPLVAQVNTGELRLKVTDSTGLGLKATVVLSSEANQYFSELTTDAGFRLPSRLNSSDKSAESLQANGGWSTGHVPSGCARCGVDQVLSFKLSAN